MKTYRFYVAKTENFADCTGSRTVIVNEEYATNDSGDGIFRKVCCDLRQQTGTLQFCGDRKKLQRWLNASAADGEKFFLSRHRAQKFADFENLANPVKKIPVKIFPVGSVVRALSGGAEILEQNGENLKIRYLRDDSGYVESAKFYEVF